MTTNLTIIGDALTEVGVISEIDTPSPEQGEKTLRKLNQMMEVWKEDGVSFGYFAQSDTTDTVPIPDWAELGVTMGLAIAIAPTYGATVSAETLAVAEMTAGMILRKSLAERLTGLDMSHLPVGAGNFGGNRNILTDS